MSLILCFPNHWTPDDKEDHPSFLPLCLHYLSVSCMYWPSGIDFMTFSFSFQKCKSCDVNSPNVLDNFTSNAGDIWLFWGARKVSLHHKRLFLLQYEKNASRAKGKKMEDKRAEWSEELGAMFAFFVLFTIRVKDARLKLLAPTRVTSPGPCVVPLHCTQGLGDGAVRRLKSHLSGQQIYTNW